MVWAQVNVFGNAGDRVYCGIYGNGTETGYTNEEDLSSGGAANSVMVGAVSLSGGNSTVHVECESSGSAMSAFSALSLTPVAVLN